MQIAQVVTAIFAAMGFDQPLKLSDAMAFSEGFRVADSSDNLKATH
jgi:hypothetical protein